MQVGPDLGHLTELAQGTTFVPMLKPYKLETLKHWKSYGFKTIHDVAMRLYDHEKRMGLEPDFPWPPTEDQLRVIDDEIAKLEGAN